MSTRTRRCDRSTEEQEKCKDTCTTVRDPCSRGARKKEVCSWTESIQVDLATKTLILGSRVLNQVDPLPRAVILLDVELAEVASGIVLASKGLVAIRCWTDVRSRLTRIVNESVSDKIVVSSKYTTAIRTDKGAQPRFWWLADPSRR